MKLQIKFILFVVILHLIALALTFFIFEKNKLFFILAEGVIVISIGLSFRLYNELITPLKTLMQGTEAIRDRDFTVKFMPTGKMEIDQLIHVYNQMIDQLRIERTLQEQQHFFLGKLVNTSPTGIIILDYDGLIRKVNVKALGLLGITEREVIGRPVTDLPGAFAKPIGTMKSGDTITMRPNGLNTFKLQKAHFIDKGFPRQFITIEELTAEILAAEKSTYEKVIRMMAHEVNNTVGPVNSIIESTLKSNGSWSTGQQGPVTNALRVAFERNQNLNLFMRNFADLVKLPEANKKITNVVALVRSVASLMEIKAAENGIELLVHADQDVFHIAADAQQMEQVLINIVKNAIEAIDDKGTIEIIVNSKGRQLLVTDNGKGITASEEELLFTPFFSTKKDGQGIGLILVREILMNHSFDFSLRSTHGKTVFKIGV